MIQPYYERPGVTVYCADCLDVLPWLPDIDTLLTDPPYGKNERTDRKSKGRGNACESNDFPPVYGDDHPFDPSHLLHYPRVILWGANYYADKLPPVSCWLTWDKRDGVVSDDNADCEMAWTNLDGPARLFRHLWKGMIKASQQNECRVHPTQKPVALMKWCLEQAQPQGIVCDPYMGSGSTLRAAIALGHPVIGVEIEERYCEIAVKRLAQRSLFELARAELRLVDERAVTGEGE